MKSKLLIIFLTLATFSHLYAENLLIEAKDISINKNKKTTIFKDSVKVETGDQVITSQFAEYNKEKQEIILKQDIVAKDKQNNEIKSEHAEYNKIKDVFKTFGITNLKSSKNYLLEGEDIVFDNKNKKIFSSKSSVLTDLSGNKIYLKNFEYLIDENIFKSIGLVKIVDQFRNSYEFSQIYIDTQKKEILGTDIKAFLNSEDFKINNKNDPRVFANSMQSNENGISFNKSIFTLCEFREGEKCPPWTLQASKMTQDNKKKTIYYKNAVVKIFNIPIFYTPYLSHPDPTVDRRSGLLPPTFSSSKNLGSGVALPYFWAMNADKNFTATTKFFGSQHPLFIGEYHQAFKNSEFLLDFGYTDGYKKTSNTKKPGNKSHFFSQFVKNFKGNDNSETTFKLTTQDVSNDKYLKLYKLKSNLINQQAKETLENSIDYTYTKEDLFFGFNASVYETLNNNYNDKYEYIFPEITIDKNLLSTREFGNLDLQTNFKVHNYDTNRQSSFFNNELNWISNDLFFNSKIKNNFLGKLKNINYESKNIDIYKDDYTNELFGAAGLLSEIELQKKKNNSTHLLTPKLLLKLAPGSMRKEIEGSRLTPINAFNLNRVEEFNNFETGNSATIGFDFNIKKKNLDKFNFSVAQIINEKENKKFHSLTGMDEKLSDLVGEASFNLNEKINFSYEFNVDQNYQDLNYSDFNANINFKDIDFDFNYIEENKHLGDQQYFKSKVSYKNKDKNLISFETKRNLVTNSSEFYDLSYEYINDCLRAGLVYRREFYNDSELEAENSLMFNITLIPFGKFNSPKINK
jgi:LPS-assembly protein